MTGLEELFKVLKEIGSKPYMLVAGNTAHGNLLDESWVLWCFNWRKSSGVYRRNDNIEAFIDINGIEELRGHAIGKELVIGGNVNLTETMDILREASKLAGFEYCSHLVDHIDLIANVPVRNVSDLPAFSVAFL